MGKELEHKKHYQLTSGADEITHGLFGGIISFVFEILPYLHSKKIFPSWKIQSYVYGTEPDYSVIPGVFDLAYQPDDLSAETINLSTLRKHQVSALGNNWQEMHDLWFSYFRIPARIVELTERTGDFSRVLGIHYRGKDKNVAGWDTNPVTQQEFIFLIRDFLPGKKNIDTLFIATDEPGFIDQCQHAFPEYRQIHFPTVMVGLNKGQQALLDSYTLSRCSQVLMTSSALSAYAKLFNPSLECYRVAASKLYASNPYFPIAYIPKLQSTDADCQRILSRLFKDDWCDDIRTNQKFKTDFTSYKKNSVDELKYRGLHFINRVRNKLVQ